MTNNLKIFENPEFGQIRTLEINNAVWFVGKDVAEALGYINSSKALAKQFKRWVTAEVLPTIRINKFASIVYNSHIAASV